MELQVPDYEKPTSSTTKNSHQQKEGGFLWVGQTEDDQAQWSCTAPFITCPRKMRQQIGQNHMDLERYISTEAQG